MLETCCYSWDFQNSIFAYSSEIPGLHPWGYVNSFSPKPRLSNYWLKAGIPEKQTKRYLSFYALVK